MQKEGNAERTFDNETNESNKNTSGTGRIRP